MSQLEKINSPEDLRRLRLDDLQGVAEEVRQYILETMSRVGGHTGASLGAIELAVALHYAFDTPHDRLVWDVATRLMLTRFLRDVARACPPSNNMEALAASCAATSRNTTRLA